MPLLFLLIVLLATLQDYLEAILLDQGFYISESLLFKLIWILFIPAVGLLTAAYQSRPGTMAPGYRMLLLAIPLSLVHILLASLISAFIAQNTLGLPFSFIRIGTYWLSHEFFLILAVYGLLLGYLSYSHRQKTEGNFLLPVSHSYAQTLLVRQGKKLIPIPVKEIYRIRAAAPYIDICTAEQHYLHHSSLKQILKTLDPDVFTRIHRSTIVNVHHIQALKSRSNGDYDVFLHNGTVLRWSRNYHNDLKKLLHLS